MLTEPENQQKEEKPDQASDNSNEDIAKQIPTVIPDMENPEPGPNEEDDK